MSLKVIVLLGLVAGFIVSIGCHDAATSFKTKSRRSIIWSNQFAVHVPDGADAAAAIADKHGFDNIGQVSHNLNNFKK